MKYKRHLNAWPPYTDAFMMLFAVAMMLVSLLVIVAHVQAKKNEDFHPKAEFLVTLTWDDKRNVDLDVWLQPPGFVGNKAVSYMNREVKNMALDRDSRGYLTNRTDLENGKVLVSANREIIAVRAIVPGDYVVAITYYDGIDNVDGVEGTSNYHYPIGQEDPKAKVQARLQVDKVNPTVTTIIDKTVDMTFVKQVVTVAAFHVDENGDIKPIPTPETPFFDAGNGGLFMNTPRQ